MTKIPEAGTSGIRLHWATIVLATLAVLGLRGGRDPISESAEPNCTLQFHWTARRSKTCCRSDHG